MVLLEKGLPGLVKGENRGRLDGSLGVENRSIPQDEKAYELTD